jgi:hypothetical protein
MFGMNLIKGGAGFLSDVFGQSSSVMGGLTVNLLSNLPESFANQGLELGLFDTRCTNCRNKPSFAWGSSIISSIMVI